MRAAAAAALVALALCACASGPGDDVDEERAADANAALGVDYMRKGNDEAALEKLRRALSFDDDHVQANWALALVYQRLQEYEKADEHFRRAIDASPAPQILNSYGVFLCERDRPEEAMGYFERAAGNPRYTTPSNAWANAGVCLQRAGRTDKAREYLRRALDAEPDHAAALAAMARLQFAAGDHLSARAFLQRRDAAASLDDELLLLAVRNELALGDRAEARGYLRRYNKAHAEAELTLDDVAKRTHD